MTGTLGLPRDLLAQQSTPADHEEIHPVTVRTAAHLRAVHDVACHLTDIRNHDHPQLTFDRDAVRYGAATHGAPTAADRTIEDLLSLADKIWKGRRSTDLKTLLVDRFATATGTEPWQPFLHLDTVLDRRAAGADARTGFQAVSPTTN